MLNGKELKKSLKKIHLVFVTDKRPGIMRQKIGQDFKYYDSEGKIVRDNKILSRIKALVIPPAWENVWICENSKGHLQATGYDEKGRKQYIYHKDWIKLCQGNKFNKMVPFGHVLPKIRAQAKKDMALRGLPRKKVIATVVWLLENTFIRVGNDEYAKENDSFGLTTLRNKHAKVLGDNVNLEFIGKSGVRHSVNIHHPKVAKIIRSCIELPGYELFQYVDGQGKKHTVDSADVNEYLKVVTGKDITAKDFRTWGATLISAQHLQKKGQYPNEKTFKKNITETVKMVAKLLRNTPAVCRSYYIHPTIFKTYQENILLDNLLKTGKAIIGLTLTEQLLISLLKKYPAGVV